MSGLVGVLLGLVRLFFQTIPLALGQVWANKTRAMLTALGIIIGVSSVIAVIGGLTGMQRFVLGEFESIGAKKMWVWGEVPEGLEKVIDRDSIRMTPREAELLAERSESIEFVAPQCGTSEEVSYGEKTVRGVSVTGVVPEWHVVEDRQTVYGRPLNRIDNEQRRNVCLVNDVAVDRFGMPTDPTGQIVLVGGRRFLVVGLLETKKSGFNFEGEPRPELFVPFDTSKAMNPYTWTWFVCQVTDPDRALDAVADARGILRQHRGLSGEDADTFGVQVIQNAISQFNAVAAVIGTIALIVVSISLLVGGIGIMNIMLVSVSERTREIGLRKALGARPAVVLAQFLVEAVVLCVLGGLIGLGLGMGLVLGGRFIPDFPLDEATVPGWAVGLSLGFSASVGLIFGMFPAMKAAALSPIDALRHE